MRLLPRRLSMRHPAQVVVAGFVIAILAGAGLLTIPFATTAGS